MTLYRRIAVALFITLTVSCKSTGSKRSEALSEDNQPPLGDIQFPNGKSETLLVSNPKGPWALVAVDKRPTKIADIDIKIAFKIDPNAEVFVPPPQPQTLVSSTAGKFYVLANEKLLVIDGKTGKIETTHSIPQATGFIAESSTKGYVFTKSEVKEFNLTTGKEGRSIPFAAEAWDFSEQHLLASSVTELVAIKKSDFSYQRFPFKEALKARYDRDKKEYDEAQARGERRGRFMTIELIAPALSVSWNKRTNLVEVTSSSVTGRESGGNVVVDLTAGKVRSIDLPNTFSGSRYFLNKTDRLIILEHTATPTSSTHVMIHRYDSRGEPVVLFYVEEETSTGKKVRRFGDPEKERSHGTAFDLFDVNNNLQFNQDENIAAMGSACVTGFCTAGKGVILYNVVEDRRLPNITPEELGFVPDDAFFLKF